MGIDLNTGESAWLALYGDLVYVLHLMSLLMFWMHYADDEEEFFGAHEEDHVLASEINEDEEELAEDEQETMDLSEFSSSQDSEDVVFLDTDSEKKIVQDKFRQGCGCSDNCYSRFSVDEVFLIRLNMNELEKGDKDMLILGTPSLYA